MDEVNARLQPQGSICSDSNGDEISGSDVPATIANLNRRICLIGKLSEDAGVREVAESFQVPIVVSKDGQEYIQDTNSNSYSTIFVLDTFDRDIYNILYKLRQPLLGPLALKQLSLKNETLPDNTRPLYNLAMSGVVVCFTGFRSRSDLASLVPIIHHMGGSIRKNMSTKVTHLIANICTGEKYQYAALFRVPAMDPKWVYASWERRDDINFSATLDVFVAEHKLKPFHGARVCFVGFPDDEEKHMTEVLLSNGGEVCATIEDPSCTHIVMERAAYTLEAASAPLSPKSSPDQSIPVTPQLINRKRKSSIDRSTSKMKRRKDKCASECKRKVSGIFKTPLNYFSNRRRTVDASTLNDSLINQSVMSSSGMFTVQDLNDCDETTPKRAPLRRSLFARTFSSSKFTRTAFRHNKKCDLNATKLSFADHSDDNDDKFNATCFPSISSTVPVINVSSLKNHCDLRSERIEDMRGTSVAVVDETTVTEKPDSSIKTFVVKAEWFWTSVQKEVCLDEKDYLYDDYVELTFSPSTRRESHHHQATPSSASRRKRKRLAETLLSLHQQSPGLHKRRSSVSDAGLLSVSGSFLDCTASPDKVLNDGVETQLETPRKGQTRRHQAFLELLQTESNYVDILNTIMTMFKKHLEEMSEEEALLNNTELNLIFGKIPPIHEAHVKMLNDMRVLSQQWSEDKSIGNIIVNYSNELQKAYPPYINYFEEMKEMLTQCDQNKPRFHAFLKACQTRAECGRQSLQELMIRPVQRLGSVCLLLADILKHTPNTTSDHCALEKALAALKEVMILINEDKRKTEAQVTLFNIFNEIDNCPPDIVSSHRNFIAKADVIQISNTEGLSSKGNSLVLFVFSDVIEVCKKKSKSFNNLKSPSGTTATSLQRPLIKPYKHVKLVPLNTIKNVVDIRETEQCQKAFCLVCKKTEEATERVYSFAMADEDADKKGFLKTLTRQMANNACTPDSDVWLAHLEAHQLDIDTSDVNNGTLSKAIKFANRTKLKVGRAFSFNKTPNKLKRAVSSMMSPFGSSNNLTPASELAQMRLASYSNINELGHAENASESLPVAPMSVQPTRKMKTNSLNSNALKRL